MSRRGEPWCVEDDLDLLRLHGLGWSVERLSTFFERSQCAVDCRLSHLADEAHPAHQRLPPGKDLLCGSFSGLSLSPQLDEMGRIGLFTKTHCTGKRLYVLQLEGGKYYVGTTRKSAQARLDDHRAGQGSAWTRVHPPQGLLWEETPYRAFSEDATTLLWMAVMGVEAVRGGKYSQLVLSESQLGEIRCSLTHDAGRCFACGSETHFEQDCPLKK
jgi:hypothetical protein